MKQATTRSWALLVAASLLAGLFAVDAPAAAAPSRATSGIGLSVVRAMVVDPGTGRIFVSGDDSVVVLDPAGSVLREIPSVHGAWGIDAAQGSIWVNQSTAGSIVEIDPTSMAVVRRIDVGAELRDSLTIVGDVAWIGGGLAQGGVWRYDFRARSGQRLGSFYNPAITRLGSSTTEVLITERNLSSTAVELRASTPGFELLAEAGSYAVGKAYAPPTTDGEGTWVWVPSASLHQLDATTLAPTGVTYGDEATVRTIWSAAHGGSIANLESGIPNWTLHVYPEGSTSPITSVAMDPSLYGDYKDFALAPAGDRGYLLRDSGVEVVDLTLAPGDPTPAAVVAGVPTQVTVEGRGLGHTDTATIDGRPLQITDNTSGLVTVAIPASVPTGSHTVSFDGPMGPWSTTVSVLANTGSVLSGTVRVGDDPVAADLTLASASGSTPLQTATAPDGRYSFPPQPGPGPYELTVHDPSGTAPDQVIGPVDLTPNAPTTLDVDLAAPGPDRSELTRVALGSGPATDLVVEPTTGRAFVAAGDQVVVIEDDGSLAGRVRERFGASSLSATADGQVFVGRPSEGRIDRISPTSLEVTGSWPVGLRMTGTIAAAGGRVWFATDLADAAVRRLTSLDPATGATTVWTTYPFDGDQLRSTSDDPDLFTATATNLTSQPSLLIDASGAEPAVLASTNTFRFPTAPFRRPITVAATGEAYDSLGRVFRLDDLSPTGLTYPASGPPAYSPGRGGVVAFGTSVALRSTPLLTHDFGETATAAALDPAGTRLSTVEGDDFVVRGLAPQITSYSRSPVHPESTIEVRGRGLGAASTVQLDGEPLMFTASDPAALTIELGPLPSGIHRIEVTTPWGSSGPTPLDIVALGPPQAPDAPESRLVGTDVEVSWTGPSDDGGRPITGYTVAGSPSGGCTSVEPTCIVTGATPGAATTFTVTATNELGTSPASPASSSIAVPGPPAAPSDLVVAPNRDGLYAYWSAPIDTGGLPVTGYQVCASTDPAVPIATSTCETTVATGRTLTGLAPDIDHYVAVRATNDAGTGPASATAGPARPYTSPGVPTDVVALAGPRSVQVSWAAPIDPGAHPITSYEVCASADPAVPTNYPSRCTTTNGETEALVDSLPGGTELFVAVRAGNAGGYGDASAAIAVAIPTSAPGTPLDVYPYASPSGVEVAWFKPTSDGGSPITGYRVCHSTDPLMAPEATTCRDLAGPFEVSVQPSLLLEDLDPTAVHYITVAAFNAVGLGNASSPAEGIDLSLLPGAPTNVEVAAGDRSVTVSWTAPASAGTSPLRAYAIRALIEGVPDAWTIVDADQTSATITGLTNGTPYTFLITARNSEGYGLTSAGSAIAIPTPPNPAAPFPSWDAFVRRQLEDFTGAPGTTASRAAAVAELSAGSITKVDFVREEMSDPWFDGAMSPAGRLYWAYFGRIPDHGGLVYWANRRRNGTSLLRTSASFAASAEFRRQYGSLADGAFVDLVYRNVMGRDPDAGGRAYWVTRLSRGTSRAQLMINFSESAEYIHYMSGRIDVVKAYAGLLRRAPSPSEVVLWERADLGELLTYILGSGEYAALVD